MAEFFVGPGTLFTPEKKSINPPLSNKVSAARTSRYDDILFWMGKVWNVRNLWAWLLETSKKNHVNFLAD